MTALAAANCFAAIVPGPADDLRAHAARTGVRVLGPHSFGIAVPRLNLNATRSHIPPPPGRLALVSQSSALTRAVIDWAGPNGVGFSHIVGLGGNADIGFGIALDWLSRDANTGAILLDIRRIKNHRVFLSAARAAARLRPVVAIRAGLRLLDDDGAADLSFEAALRRAGVLSVKRLEDLLAAAETLSRAKPVRCDTLAIVSNAIGPGRLAADSVLREGLHLPAGRNRHRTSPPPTWPPPPSPSPLDRASAACWSSTPRKVRRTRRPSPACASHRATCARRCWSAPWAKPPARCTAPPWRGPACRSSPRPDQAVQGFEHLVRDRRNREAARELPPSRVLDLAPERDRVAPLFRPGARRRPPDADPGRGAGRPGRLRHPDRADPFRRQRPRRRRRGRAAGVPGGGEAARTAWRRRIARPAA